MKKYLLIVISFVISLSIIGCGTTKIKDEDAKKLRRFDEILLKTLKEEGIKAEVQTKSEENKIITYVEVINNKDFRKEKSPENSYTLKVFNDTFLILGYVTGLAEGYKEDLGNMRPDSVTVITKSKNERGYIKANAKIDELSKIQKEDALTRSQSLLRVTTIDCNDEKLKKSIEFVKKHW